MVAGILAHILRGHDDWKSEVLLSVSYVCGITVPSFTFLLIDRIARFVLILYISWAVLTKYLLTF